MRKVKNKRTIGVIGKEFSRYLQNLININYPILEYNRIAVGVLMSVSLSVLTTEFIQNWNVPSTLSVLETYLLDFFVTNGWNYICNICHIFAC